jgi:hypothetical protein
MPATPTVRRDAPGLSIMMPEYRPDLDQGTLRALGSSAGAMCHCGILVANAGRRFQKFAVAACQSADSDLLSADEAGAGKVGPT